MTNNKIEDKPEPESKTNTKTEKKVTIADFIEKHHKMFTVLGVFGGLTALFTRLEDASYLAAISFVLFLLLDFELWIKFPKSEEASSRLKFFEVFMQMLLFAIGIYIVQTYTDFVYAFMPIIVMLIFGAVFFKL
jgi:hypothetical protein